MTFLSIEDGPVFWLLGCLVVSGTRKFVLYDRAIFWRKQTCFSHGPCLTGRIWTKDTPRTYSPDVTPSGWLGSKHQLANLARSVGQGAWPEHSSRATKQTFHRIILVVFNRCTVHVKRRKFQLSLALHWDFVLIVSKSTTSKLMKKSNVDSLFRLLALVASTEIAWANWSACSWLTFHFRLKTASDPSLFLECALGMTVWRGELPGQNRMPTGLSGGGCGQSCLGHSDSDRSCGGLWTDTVSRIVLL